MNLIDCTKVKQQLRSYCPNLYTVPFPVEDFLLDNGEGIFDGIVYLMILESFFNF